MKRMLVILLLALLSNLSYGSIVYVPEDYTTLQAGINSASNGDTIIVGPKRYYGEGNRNLTFGGKSLLLLSAIGQGGTMIDCEGMSRAITLQEGDGPITIDGFTLYQGQSGVAGAILCEKSTLVIKNSTIRRCIAEGNSEGGGGIYAIGSIVEIIDCTIDSNELSGVLRTGAGGITVVDSSTITIANCNISDNVGAMLGGGLYVDDFTTCSISNAQLYRNHVKFVDFPKQDGGGAYGGAISVHSTSVCSLLTCVFANNSSEGSGGAIECDNSEIYAENITAVGNTCVEGGSAITCAYNGVLDISKSLFAYNSGGDAFTVRFGSCEFSISCTDIYGNDGDWVGIIEEFADINGNISEDPILCGLTPGNLSIPSSSPCYPTNNSCNELMGALALGCVSICGDADENFYVDIDDAVYLIAYIFQSGPPPMPIQDGNVDCSEGTTSSIDIDDVVYLMQYIFGGGPEPCTDCQ